MEDIKKYRQVGYDINPIFYNRWSPRSLTGESIKQDDLMALFEAARWAPSSFNAQPWRFIYSLRDSKTWQQYQEFLFEFNKQWANKASVLIVVLSKKNYEHNDKPNPAHTFDTGAAWQNIALQAHSMGLSVRAMGGIYPEKIRGELNIPHEFDVEVMLAVGKPADKDELSQELQNKEQPTDRKPLKELIMVDQFKID